MSPSESVGISKDRDSGKGESRAKNEGKRWHDIGEELHAKLQKCPNEQLILEPEEVTRTVLQRAQVWCVDCAGLGAGHNEVGDSKYLPISEPLQFGFISPRT